MVFLKDDLFDPMSVVFYLAVSSESRCEDLGSTAFTGEVVSSSIEGFTTTFSSSMDTDNSL
jgi:hypothetical protein